MGDNRLQISHVFAKNKNHQNAKFLALCQNIIWNKIFVKYIFLSIILTYILFACNTYFVN